MASHAGLILVFKNKDGYIDEKGNIVKDKNQARKVSFYEAGFSDPIHILNKLGLNNNSIDLATLKLETLIPSYDSRLGNIEEYFREMGCDYYTACNKAAQLFDIYQLYDYDKFLRFLKELEQKAISYYMSHSPQEQIEVEGIKTPIYYVNNPYNYSTTEYSVEKFYTSHFSLYKYSLKLKNPHVEKYFNLSLSEQEEYNNWQNNGIDKYINDIIQKFNETTNSQIKVINITIYDGKLQIYAKSLPSDLIDMINNGIRDFYNNREMHITRMFGSYILLRKENTKLSAIKATNVPIKYCPLMVKLLKEVGGAKSEELIKAIQGENSSLQSELMCRLIDEVVIKGGYFDTNRPLNSCEANVLFGASETISSAFKKNIVDAAVIVSNNLGTIITTNNANTQGAVKRMTGLFYTSPSEKIMETAKSSQIIPVFPYTATIDQIAGVKEAIRRGYKNIAVTFAAQDNELLEQLKNLEQEGITIYKFGLCSTGINEKTAKIMLENADIIWSCASKYVKEYIEPNAIAQVGIKIPVHIMTRKGWQLVKNHLEVINEQNNFEDVSLSTGENKPILLNTNGSIKKLTKKDIHNCQDCPHPCI